jgi:DNA polymerase III delta prime subunit
MLSLHGPPGVGKTETVLQLAKSLYYESPETEATGCLKGNCPTYKVRSKGIALCVLVDDASTIAFLCISTAAEGMQLIKILMLTAKWSSM